MATDQARKILSIDGCGFRGRTQLLILDRIMQESAPGKNPCDVFDLICGTAAGGLIAIFLGRLNMSCKDAIKAYDDLEQTLFGTASLDDISKMTGGFNTQNFQNSLSALVKKLCAGASTLFMDPNNKDPLCKTFVTVMDANSFDDVDPHILRSYNKVRDSHRPSRSDQKDPEVIPDHKWETSQAAIGSVSCPRLFNPLELSPASPLLQAANASGFANPAIVAYVEALDLWGTNAVLTLVSLGMGIRNRADPRDNWHNTQPLPEKTLNDTLLALGVAAANSATNERLRDFIRQTKRVATSTQVKHIRLDERMKSAGPHQKYYRFDPTSDGRGLVLIDYGPDLKPAIEQTATGFMNSKGTEAQLKEVAGNLKISHGLVVRMGSRCGTGKGGVVFNGRHSTVGARLKRINVWTRPWVNSIELVYEFQGKEFSTGRYGGFGGTRNTLELKPGEYIYRVSGQASEVIIELSFYTRTLTQSNAKPYTYGEWSPIRLLNPFNYLNALSNLQSSLDFLLSGTRRPFDATAGNEPFVGLGWFEGASGELLDSLTPCFIRQDCVSHI